MSIASMYSQYKVLFEHSLGFHNDALHVFAGALVQIAVAILFKKNLGERLPLLVVFLLEVANEVNDVMFESWPDPVMQMGEGFKDLMLTLSLPVLFFVLVRTKPELFGAKRDPRPTAVP